MKKLALFLILAAAYLPACAQDHSDHDMVMEKFKNYYNSRQSDSIESLFPKPSGLWGKKGTEEIFTEYGAIKSLEYIGEMNGDAKTKLYKATAEKKTFAIGISLQRKNKLGNFRFDTRSAYINKLMGIAPEHPEHPREDYDKVMARFQQYYNSKADESIANMFSTVWEKNGLKRSDLWANGESERLLKEFGEIRSFKFIGEMDDDPSVKLYRVVTTKQTYATGLSIDKDSQLLTFRFKTSSPYINKLLKQNK